jgi:hypothetical protein
LVAVGVFVGVRVAVGVAVGVGVSVGGVYEASVHGERSVTPLRSTQFALASAAVLNWTAHCEPS